MCDADVSEVDTPNRRRTMKRIALSMFAVATIAAPAFAQGYNPHSFAHWNLNGVVNSIQSHITGGTRNGSLTPRESSRLQQRLNEINSLRQRLSQNGLSRSEYARLDDQLDDLVSDVYRERHDSQFLGSQPWDWCRGNGAGNNWNNRGNNWNNGNNFRNANVGGNPYGIAPGGIDAKEHKQINQKMNQLQKEQFKMQMSGGGLDPMEQMKLQKKANQLNKKINKDRYD